jgi:hypothetical protein
MYPQGKEPCIEFIGIYDTARLAPTNWIHGNTTVVCFNNNSAVVIWGKKCEFTKDDSLFVKSVWWGSIQSWKYSLVNRDESIRYSLLDP